MTSTTIQWRGSALKCTEEYRGRLMWDVLEALFRLGQFYDGRADRRHATIGDIKETSGYGSTAYYGVAVAIQFGLVHHFGYNRGYTLTDRGKIALAIRHGKQARTQQSKRTAA